MHTNARRRLPAPVGRLLSFLPSRPGSWLFASTLNLALARHLPPDVRATLSGKRLRLTVVDAGLSFDFQWNGHAFAAIGRGSDADLAISASAHDFGLMAARKEDPDTLFFSRRLVMEGDTELGLLVKNTLDGIEQPLFDPQQLAPHRLFERLRARRARPRPGAPLATQTKT